MKERQFNKKSKCGRVIRDDFDRAVPHLPTHHLPGSKKKVAIMRWRYLNGYSIFHPDDVRLDDSEKLLRVLIAANKDRLDALEYENERKKNKFTKKFTDTKFI